MGNKWDSLSKADRVKHLEGAGLPTGLAQLNWSGLQKSERKKLEKGKGWFEAKEPVMTARGIEHLAPEHHRVAVKKEAGKALNKRMERKEGKEQPQKTSPIPASALSDLQGIKRETEATLLNRESFDFYFIRIPRSSAAIGTRHGQCNLSRDTQPGDAPQLCCDWELHYTRPNGHKDKVTLNAENNLVGAKLAFNEWNEANEATVYKILPHQTVEEEQAGYKNHPKFDWLKSTGYPIQFPIIFDNEKTLHQPEAQGIKLATDEEKFVRGIYKQASEGATIKEFGTRLYVWRGDEAYATKHITDSEYMALKAIIKGVHQVSRADALKNLKEGREKEAKITKEIEERKAQEAGMTPNKLKDKMSELNKVYNNFRQKYGRSGVKKETQRQALADFVRLGRETANDMAKQLGFNNLDEVPDFGLRNKLGDLYDPNTFMEDMDRFLKQIEIKVKEAKLPVKDIAGQGV